jgi:phage tail-like protein
MSQEYEFHLNIKGPDRSWVYVIPAGVSTIGRQPGCDLILEQQGVSRQHARIHCEQGECEIADLGSSNGTRLNGAKLIPRTPMPLADNDRINIGAFELIVERILVQRPEVSQPDLSQTSSLAEEQVAKSDRPISPPPSTPPPPPPAPTQPSYEPSMPPPGLSFRSEKLLNYLPDIYQGHGSDFLSRFLAIFEAILFPIEWQVDNFDLFLSPATAPASFLPWLENWFGVLFDSTWSEQQRRQFLKDAYWIYGCQGTRRALSRVLEIYTGQVPRLDDTSPNLAPHTFQVSLRLRDTAVTREQIERLVNACKPAHTAYTLELDG